MNPAIRAAIESRHAEFLTIVTGLPVTAKASVGERTVFEVSDIAVVPDYASNRGASFFGMVRIKSNFEPREARP